MVEWTDFYPTDRIIRRMVTRVSGIVVWAMLAGGCGGKSEPPLPPVFQPVRVPIAEQQGPAGVQALSADVHVLVDLPSGQDFGAWPELLTRMHPHFPRQPDLIRTGLIRRMEEFIYSSLGIPADAVNLKLPMRLVIMNPKKLSDQTPVVVVVRVADPAKLDSSHEHIQMEIQGEYALIGPASAFSLLTPKDIAILTVPAEVNEPEFTLLVRDHVHLDPAFEKRNMRSRTEDEARMLIDAMGAFINQCDRIIIRAQVRRGIGQISAHVVFAKGSRLAEFAGAQAPTDHALLGRLPAGSAHGVFVVGQLTAGPFYPDLANYLEASARAKIGPASAQHVRTMLEQFTGTILIHGLGTRSDQPVILLLEGMDSDFVMHHFRALGEKDDAQSTPHTFLHDGIEVEVLQEGQSTDRETMIAGFGRYFMAVDGRGVEATARAIVDVARGKGKAFVPSAPMKAALERSRARKDSLFLFTGIADVGPFLDWQPSGVQAVVLGISFGQSDAVLTLEFLLRSRFH